jgi:glycosyltransferase involved in cell wall biosynthesis
VIPNAVQWPLPISSPLVAPPPKRGGRLLGVGRLTSQKGFDVLLRCFARVAPVFEDWQLVILGEGDQRPVLERMISQLSLSGRVEMPGNVGNVTDWYSASDIYVMTSLYEGFPMTLIEAMSHGLAVVSFDCETGPREIIRDGMDGILVDDGDADSMVRQLMELMADEPRRATMGSRAREVRTRLSVESVSKRWEALFEEAFRLSRWTMSDSASVDLIGAEKASETSRATSRSRR